MMRKKLILYISIAIIPLIFFVFISTLSLKKQLDLPKTTVLLSNQTKTIVPANSTSIEKSELPLILKNYYEHSVDMMFFEYYFSKHKFQRILYLAFLDGNYTQEDKINILVNQGYFDNGLIGLGNAANYYFNKEIKQLTISEQIFLLYKQTHSETNQLREDLNVFLSYLLEEGIIVQKDKAEAEGQIETLTLHLDNSKTIAQSYIELVTTELVSELNMDEAEIFRKGFIIQTNLDYSVQSSIYDAFHNEELFPDHPNTKIEAGMAIIEYRTGKIVGVMGGRDYQTSTYNRATDTTRQPASTFKPLLVHAPAIDLGWKPESKLKDVPMKFGDFTPKNYDQKYHGEVTLQESLTMSYNVPTTWLLSQIGIENGINYLEKFNLFSINPEDGYQLALGYTSVGTSPLAMAESYSVFPNAGEYIEAKAVDAIKLHNGKVIYNNALESKVIFSSKTAEVVSNMLEDVIKNGTGKEAQIDGQVVAGKTGTTSYDGWFVGYNGKYSGAIWLGPDEVEPKNRMNIDGGGYPATIFHRVFSVIK